MKGCIGYKWFFYFLVLFAVSAFLASAAYEVTTFEGTTTFAVNEDVGYIYNISVNNSDTGAIANISQVNVSFPSTFSFIVDSNTTDSGITHTFTNTSSVLSWEGDGLVMNLTVNYFWFNMTASTPGNYNLTVTVLNATDTSSTNLSVVVNDTTAPVITLASPAAGLSTTSTAFNFTFNVNDSSSISSCILVFDGSTIHSISSVSTSALNGMYNSSFSTGAHNWSINCTDAASNVGNSSVRVLTITAATVEEEDSSGSTGSSGSPTFTLSESQLKEGYEKEMYERWKLSFKIGSKSHMLTIGDITEDTVRIKVESDPQQEDLREGEEKMFELTGDGIYDLSVRALSIGAKASNLKPRAVILVTRISEPVAGSKLPAEGTVGTEETPAQSPESTGSEETSTSTGVVVAVVLILIIIVVIIYWLVKNNKSANTQDKTTRKKKKKKQSR